MEHHTAHTTHQHQEHAEHSNQNRLRENLSVLPHFPSGGEPKEEGLEKWLCKWEVMDYLKITKTKYYRWRREGKLVPRNGIGEDRYLWNDIKNIVKKRIG